MPDPFRNSRYFKFDGIIDIFEAAERLDGWHYIKTDLPTTLIAYGNVDEVGEYG